jgi:hypothetical protein
LIAQYFAQLGAFVLGQATKALAGVTDRLAQLDRLKSRLGQLLNRAGKVLGDLFSNGPCLASNRQA